MVIGLMQISHVLSKANDESKNCFVTTVFTAQDKPEPCSAHLRDPLLPLAQCPRLRAAAEAPRLGRRGALPGRQAPQHRHAAEHHRI